MGRLLVEFWEAVSTEISVYKSVFVAHNLALCGVLHAQLQLSPDPLTNVSTAEDVPWAIQSTVIIQ